MKTIVSKFSLTFRIKVSHLISWKEFTETMTQQLPEITSKFLENGKAVQEQKTSKQIEIILLILHYKKLMLGSLNI